MQGSQDHGRVYYRGKFPAEYAVTEQQSGRFCVSGLDHDVVDGGRISWISGEH